MTVSIEKPDFFANKIERILVLTFFLLFLVPLYKMSFGTTFLSQNYPDDTVGETLVDYFWLFRHIILVRIYIYIYMYNFCTYKQLYIHIYIYIYIYIIFVRILHNYGINFLY